MIYRVVVWPTPSARRLPSPARLRLPHLSASTLLHRSAQRRRPAVRAAQRLPAGRSAISAAPRLPTGRSAQRRRPAISAAPRLPAGRSAQRRHPAISVAPPLPAGRPTPFSEGAAHSCSLRIIRLTVFIGHEGESRRHPSPNQHGRLQRRLHRQDTRADCFWRASRWGFVTWDLLIFTHCDPGRGD